MNLDCVTGTGSMSPPSGGGDSRVFHQPKHVAGRRVTIGYKVAAHHLTPDETIANAHCSRRSFDQFRPGPLRQLMGVRQQAPDALGRREDDVCRTHLHSRRKSSAGRVVLGGRSRLERLKPVLVMDAAENRFRSNPMSLRSVEAG